LYRKKQSLAWLYFLCVIFIIFAFKTVSSEWEKEIQILKENNNSLERQIEALEQEIKIYQEIIQRERAYIKELKEENEQLRTIRARITAYSPMDNKSGICADSNPTSTATGAYPKIGIVAVDPKKIPYGTKLIIPGYGPAIAEDTGGLIRSYDGVAIDAVMNTYNEAMSWGVRYLDIKIIL